MTASAYVKDFDGVHRADLEQRLADALETSRHLNDNLTATQLRCTQLLQELRAWKHVDAAPKELLTVLADVVHERTRQDEKWGPLGTTQSRMR